MKYRIIITIIIIIAFLVAGFIIYVNNVLLPIKLKVKLTQELEKNLGKNVEIERLRYSLIKGLIVENLAIFDKVKEKSYLSAKEISFQFLIFPLFQKKIIIPLVRIDSPQINLTLRQDNTLNVMDVLKKWQAKKERPKFSIFIYRIDLSNGKCQFKDEHTDPSYIKEAVDLKIGVGMNLPTQIKFILEAKILNPQKNPSFISTTGEYNLLTQELQSKSKLANIIVNDYLLYLKTLPLSISEGIIDNADFNINLKSKQLYAKGIVNTKNLKLRKEQFVLAGDINIEPDIKYDFQNKEFGYKAIFELSNTEFLGLDYFQYISNINGKINLEENRIWSDDLKAQLMDSPINIKGILEDFSSPSIKLNISSSQINLAKLATVLPNLPKDLVISGNSTLNLEAQGSFRNLPLEIKATSEIITAKIQTPLLKEPLNDIKGKISFTANQLNWENLSFLYKQIQYNSSGSLINFKQPQMDFNLASVELALKTSLNIKDKIIKIRELSGKYLDTDFAIKGNVNIQDNTNPLLDIDLASNLYIKDVFGLLPANINDNFKKIKLDGLCKIAGTIKGNAKNIKDWNTFLKLSSPCLSMFEFKLDNLYCTLEQKDGLLNINDFTAKTYTGNLNVEFLLNLLSEVPLYTSKIFLSHIDLAKLKMDTKLKDKDISGLLSAKIDLQGTTKGLETLQGQGSISVKDGKLWELNLFKGLGEFLFMPMYQKIVFKDAAVNFSLKNKTIEITNSFLGSEKLDLACEGKLEFDGSVDLTLNSQINEDLLKDSPDVRKFTSAVLGNLLVIKIGGTIQKPEYKVVPGTKEIFKQIKRFFLGK